MTRILKALVILSFFICLLLPVAAFAQEADRQDDGVVKVDTNLVPMPVAVTTRGGGYVPDMRKEDFSAFEA